MSILESSQLLTFFAGVLAAFASVALYGALRFWIDLRITRRRTAELADETGADSRAHQAWEKVRACRKRLRFNPNPNPEWVAPLFQEVPRLVREIAAIYYPDNPDPMQGPKVSEFARAVQYASMDIAEALQSKRVGRLIDISAGQSVRAWQKGQRVWKHPRVQTAKTYLGKLEPVYKIAQPVWQVMRFKSPLTWIALAASNTAIRTLQPAVVNIIARRAIDLYSGNLARTSARMESSAFETGIQSAWEIETEAGAAEEMSPADDPSPEKKRGRLKRVADRLRSRDKRSSP